MPKKINTKDIKKLREETGAGVMEAKQMLEKFSGEYDKALKELIKTASKKVAKKADRTAGDGLVYSYIHSGSKIGSMVLVACETDFVAKTEVFIKLCHDIAMQACCEDYKTEEELLNAEYIKDPTKTISTLIMECTAKLGEKIELKKFVKFDVNA